MDNLLTLLAYLEQIQYCGKVCLNYIDDETFEVIELDIGIKLGEYNKIYGDILISKFIPYDIGILSKRAIELYFDYHSKNVTLAKLVRANAYKKEKDIISLLLKCSKDYGLSDLQAEKLINTNTSHS